jgi:hypothetical protein
MKGKIIYSDDKPKTKVFSDLIQGEYFLNMDGELCQKIEPNNGFNAVDCSNGDTWIYSNNSSITNQKSVTITVEK